MGAQCSNNPSPDYGAASLPLLDTSSFFPNLLHGAVSLGIIQFATSPLGRGSVREIPWQTRRSSPDATPVWNTEPLPRGGAEDSKRRPPHQERGRLTGIWSPRHRWPPRLGCWTLPTPIPSPLPRGWATSEASAGRGLVWWLCSHCGFTDVLQQQHRGPPGALRRVSVENA